MRYEARTAATGDIKSGGLDALIDQNRDGDVSLRHDRIILIGPADRPVGCLVWRPVAWIHELRLKRSLLAHDLAMRMVDFAIDDCLRQPWPIREVAFNIFPSNEAMANMARLYNATEQDSARVFKVKL